MPEEIEATEKNILPMKQRVLRGIGLPVWVALSFFSANFLVGLIIAILIQVKILNASTLIGSSVFMATIAAAVFVLTFVIVVGVPYVLRGSRTTREELGLTRLPIWSDILWAPVSFVIYMLVAGVVVMIATNSIPGFNADEVQDVGFENLSHYYEYVLAFITLVVVAPVAEETLFRGYLYGKLRKYMPAIGAILISSVLFASLHLSFDINPDQGGLVVSQWNVALNILPLAIILAILREKTGSIWAGILLHALKNGVAFYFLFVNPALLHTIGG